MDVDAKLTKVNDSISDVNKSVTDLSTRMEINVLNTSHAINEVVSDT